MQVDVMPTRERTRGWQAELSLRFSAVGERTLLRHAHAGPLRVQRPFFPEGGVNHTYVLHPPGGLVGDDELTIRADVEAHSHALMTTPGATKAYRNVCTGASIAQEFHVQGALEFLPQETILFDGARVRSHTHFELGGAARFVSWETVCLGRVADQQSFSTGHADFRTTVADPGGLIYDDRLVLAGGSPLLSTPWGLNGSPVAGVMLAYPAAEQLLGMARTHLTTRSQGIAATLLDRLLVVRALECQSCEVQEAFRDVWAAIRPDLLGRAPCAPRIWST